MLWVSISLYATVINISICHGYQYLYMPRLSISLYAMSISISICYEYQYLYVLWVSVYLYAMSINISMLWVSVSLHKNSPVDTSIHSITLPWSQPVFVLTPQYYVFVREAENTKLIVSGFTVVWTVVWTEASTQVITLPWYEPYSRHTSHYTTVVWTALEASTQVITLPWYEPHSRQAHKSLHYVQMQFPDIERKIGNQISPFLKMFVAR